MNIKILALLGLRRPRLCCIASVFSLVTALSTASWSNPCQAAAAQTVTAPAIAPVRTLYAGLKKIARKSNMTNAERAKLIAPVIDTCFALDIILKNSVGMRYASIPEADKQRLLNAFRNLTVARYVSSFANNPDIILDVNPSPKASQVKNDVIVLTKLGGAEDDLTAVNYIMRRVGDTYRIVDIMLNGNISQVAAQRADFNATFSAGGADALIALLNRKAQSFLNH